MKKLMIAVAIVCAAAFSQAASISWKTGMSVKGVTATGFTTGNAAAGSLDLYVFMLADETAYNNLNLSTAWDTYKSQLGSASGKLENFGGAAGGTAITNVDAPAGVESTWYAAVFTVYTDPNGKEWVIANKAETMVNASGTGVPVNNLAKNLGGGSGTAFTASDWSSASVPEPTSAMLMLFGLAGLALKRKRA